ncbi:MAG TPA: AAA family ATPase [Candidatus Limnocylindria bacterium]
MDGGTSTAQGAAGGFVGRDRELTELMADLDAVDAGSGRLVLIGGEPGVGKSRLADELTSHARHRGYEVLWGRGWEDAGAPPYWPWVQVLRQHVRAADPADIRRQLGTGIADVAQMLPDLRELFPDLPPPPAAESESARFQLFDSTTKFIRNAALARPLLIVLDDLQSADTPSLMMIRFLATQLVMIRALVVGTYRDVEVAPDHSLASTLPELAREPITRLMPLGGLQPSAVAEFIGSAAGVAPAPHLVSAVWRETKGNPLFVGEAVRLLSVEGGFDDAADLSSLRVAVPAGIRAVISRRIGHLPEETIRAMTIGAALGPEFSLDVLRRVAEIDVDHLLDLLDPAVDAGLLMSVMGGVVRYRFSHDLVRETLYDGIALGRRVRLHRRIADVLEQMAGRTAEPFLAELAFHFFQAAQGSDRATDVEHSPGDKAIDYARSAAEQASRSLAYEEAARLFRMALAVLDGADTPDPESRTEILLRLGDVEARAGEMETSRATFQEAARIAREVDDARRLARAALGYSGRLPWLRPGRDASIIQLLQDALVMLGGADDRLRVRLLIRLACSWRSSPEKREQCAALSKQAVDLARLLGDAGTLSYALAGRFWATWWPENPTERLAIAEEMVTVAESAGDAERLIDAYLMVYLASAEIPRMADAEEAEEEVRRLANELRQPSQLWLGVGPRALMALMKGDYPLAEELTTRELEWSHPLTPIGDEASAARFHHYLLRREQDRSAESEAGIRVAVEEFPWYPLHRAALVNLLLDLGRADEARIAFDDLARDEFSAIYRDNEWLLGMALAAEACARLSDVKSAEVLYRQLLQFAGRHAVGQVEGSLGAADRYLGLLASIIGDVAAAERHLGDAIDINRQMGARPWAAHAQYDLGRVLLQHGADGHPERAATLLKEALHTARTLGMTALERQVSAALEEVPAVEGDVPREASEAVFQRDGDVWAIGRDPVFRLRDSKGLRYLATLLAHPGREFHVLELVSGGTSSPAPQVSRAKATELGLRPAGAGGGIDEILDAEAKAAYRARLQELQAEVDDADASADPVRADQARAEIDALTAELSRAFGLGGRARPEGSAAERARQSVAKAVRDALNRIKAQDTSIGDHLNRSVRTGLYCAYDPDPSADVQWRTDAVRV